MTSTRDIRKEDVSKADSTSGHVLYVAILGIDVQVLEVQLVRHLQSTSHELMMP